MRKSFPGSGGRLAVPGFTPERSTRTMPPITATVARPTKPTVHGLQVRRRAGPLFFFALTTTAPGRESARPGAPAVDRGAGRFTLAIRPPRLSCQGPGPAPGSHRTPDS